jgi:hypothetical protein
MRSVFKTVRRPSSTPPCWTKASTVARSAPCTASWQGKEKRANAPTSSPILLTRSCSCWLPAPINSGVGTSPNCWGRPSGPASISTSYSTPSAAMWLDGWSPIGRVRNWPGSSSPKLAASSKSLSANSPRRSCGRLWVLVTPRSANSKATGLEVIAAPRCCQQFFPWYNTEHHHSGLGLLTPEVVHTQRAQEVRDLPQHTPDAAFAPHLERFALPTEVWINPPPKSESAPADPDKKTQ